jgi:hypothetical protein
MGSGNWCDRTLEPVWMVNLELPLLREPASAEIVFAV